MYSYNPKSVLPPVGASAGSANIIDNIDIVVTAGAAFVSGDVVMLNSLPTTIATSGSTASVIGLTAQTVQCIAGTAAGGDIRNTTVGKRIFGVILSDVASGALTTIRIRGVVAAYLGSNSATLKVAGAKTLEDAGVHASSTKTMIVLGYPLESGTGIKYVYFDGTGGLGNVATV